MQPKPFTVIGGFLGAGKTTLVNRVLAQSDGVRYAVLVNDFGDLAIDEALIARHDGRTIALANGCICCTTSDGFIAAMLDMMAASERFDHVLVEASGVSEPDRIMDFARLDPLLQPDAIVVLADAETLAVRLADKHVGQIVRQQIEAADLLLLSKADLMDTAALSTAESTLRALNSSAAIAQCSSAGLPLDLLLGTARQPGKDVSSHAHHHAADEVFHTRTIRLPASLSREAFGEFTHTLPDSILRGKGFVQFADTPGQVFLWQRVGRRDSIIPVGEPPAESALILIGTEPLDALAEPQ